MTDSRAQLGIFGSTKQSVDEALAQTAESLRAYGALHPHWCIAWSGGKDSTATLTTVLYLIESGAVPRPDRLTVLYADTRLELLPLWLAAADIREQLRARGVEVRIVMAPLDKRFFVYMLGRGVPPPNNGTLRWCTPQLKINPMVAELRDTIGTQAGTPALMHWRVCNIWDWLNFYAPSPEHGAWRTSLIAVAYSTDENSESHARTGCVGCPLATRDLALDLLTARAEWAYLAPLHRLRPLYRTLREPANRLRQPGGERRKDGTLTSSQHRMGPLTFEARLRALDEVLAIQREVNATVAAGGRPPIDILNAEEEARIRELVAARTWPNGWTGDEPIATEPFIETLADGSVQANLFGDA